MTESTPINDKLEAESKTTAAEPVEVTPAPTETAEPVDTAPVEAAPAEPAPTEPEPEAAPTEPEPVEDAPAESEPEVVPDGEEAEVEAAPTNGLLPLDQVARQVVAGSWGSGDEGRRRLVSAGYDADAVQAEVTRQVGSAPASRKKSAKVIANEVLAGKWGNGQDRDQQLSAAGYNTAEVQEAVDAKLGTKLKHTATRLTVTALATQVIAGDWGKHQERAQRLASAGYDPKAVQAEVNRRLK